MTGGRDSVCRVWDIRSKVQVFALSGHTNTVGSVLTQAVDPQVGDWDGLGGGLKGLGGGGRGSQHDTWREGEGCCSDASSGTGRARSSRTFTCFWHDMGEVGCGGCVGT